MRSLLIYVIISRLCVCEATVAIAINAKTLRAQTHTLLCLPTSTTIGGMCTKSQNHSLIWWMSIIIDVIVFLLMAPTADMRSRIIIIVHTSRVAHTCFRATRESVIKSQFPTAVHFVVQWLARAAMVVCAKWAGRERERERPKERRRTARMKIKWNDNRQIVNLVGLVGR